MVCSGGRGRGRGRRNARVGQEEGSTPGIAVSRPIDSHWGVGWHAGLLVRDLVVVVVGQVHAHDIPSQSQVPIDRPLTAVGGC